MREYCLEVSPLCFNQAKLLAEFLITFNKTLKLECRVKQKQRLDISLHLAEYDRLIYTKRCIYHEDGDASICHQTFACAASRTRRLMNNSNDWKR